MEKTIQFHIEQFDGPLDLLLALVAKNKMSIYDIEILTLIDQYLAIVGAGEEASDGIPSADGNPSADDAPSAEGAPPEDGALDVMSDFIAVAARLVQMKSQLLLPRSDEGERMREELTGLLVEYSACKEVAAQLAQMAAGVHIAVRAPQPFEHDATYRGLHSPDELAAALEKIGGRRSRRRAPQREQFDEIVAAPFVSVTGKVIHVLRGLVTGKVDRIRQLFTASRGRSETVATFLALLELIRGGRVAVADDGGLRLNKGGQKE